MLLLGYQITIERIPDYTLYDFHNGYTVAKNVEQAIAVINDWYDKEYYCDPDLKRNIAFTFFNIDDPQYDFLKYMENYIIQYAKDDNLFFFHELTDLELYYFNIYANDNLVADGFITAENEEEANELLESIQLRKDLKIEREKMFVMSLPKTNFPVGIAYL